MKEFVIPTPCNEKQSVSIAFDLIRDKENYRSIEYLGDRYNMMDFVRLLKRGVIGFFTAYSPCEKSDEQNPKYTRLKNTINHILLIMSDKSIVCLIERINHDNLDGRLSIHGHTISLLDHLEINGDISPYDNEYHPYGKNKNIVQKLTNFYSVDTDSSYFSPDELNEWIEELNYFLTYNKPEACAMIKSCAEKILEMRTKWNTNALLSNRLKAEKDS